MSLFDIKNKLYKRDAEEDLSSHGQTEFDLPVSTSHTNRDAFSEKDAWVNKDGDWLKKNNNSVRYGAIAFFIIFVIIFFASVFYIVRKASFDENRVTIEISGSKTAGSGKLLTYEISYKNDNRSVLRNAILRISFPESFKPEDNPNFRSEGPTTGSYDLGQIDSHQTGKVVLNGRMFSPKGALAYIKTDLIYMPSNFSSQFTAQQQLGINVDSAPVNIEVMAPQNIASGDAVDYLITYVNNGQEIFDNLKIRAEYPDNFVFSKSDPTSLEGNNIWYIGRVAPGQSGKIVVSGKLTGNRDEIKTVVASVGSVENGQFTVFSEERAVTKIAASPIVVRQTVNGVDSLSVNSGESLNFEISFSNPGTTGLRDVIVTEQLGSPILDYSTLETAGGYYDSANKTITWKSSNVPALKVLEPGQGGSINFSVKVLGNILVNGSNDKNFIISSLAKVDSPDIPTPLHLNKIISGNEMDIKLNSKMILDTKGFYNDTSIANSGPMPLVAGKETTYTFHWKVSNVSNDVNNARVEATLPTGVAMTGKVFPEDARITYNERSNLVVWELGTVAAGTGVLNSPKEASFQIRVKPSPDKVGKEMDLLGLSTLSGQDDFTKQDLKTGTDKKTTVLFEDASIGNGYRVSD